MDNNARRKLVDKAIEILDEGHTLLAVGLVEFFEGNTDEASIGVNLPREKHIGLEGFRRVLSDIRGRPDVQDVFIELTEIPDPDEAEDDGIWPTACVAFIVTSAALEEVEQWVAALHPRELREGWLVQPGVKTPLAPEDLRPGMRPVHVWLL
jgi:hypothetical protein